MPGEVRDPLEAAFGHDFSAVRVHADGPVSALARDSGARAFALGADLAFAPGEWAPATRRGRALIAHELAHVALQARDGEPRYEAKGPNEKSVEQEADEELKASVSDPKDLNPNSPEYARSLQGYAFKQTHDSNFSLLPEPTDAKQKAAWKRRFDKAGVMAQRIISESGSKVEQKESRAGMIATDLATAGFIDKAMALAAQLTEKEQQKFVYDAALGQPGKVTADQVKTIAAFSVSNKDALGDHMVLSRLEADEGAYAKQLGPDKVVAALRVIVNGYKSDAELPQRLAKVTFWSEPARAAFTKMMLEEKQGALLEQVSSQAYFVEGAKIQTQAGGEVNPSGGTLAWAVANKQKVVVDDIVALGAASGVTITAPAKTDIASLKAWLQANTEKIGEAVEKQNPGDKKAARALLARIEQAFMYHVDPNGEDIKPNASGGVTHLQAGGPAKATQLKVDCDVLSTYGVRMLVAGSFTPIGYMAISPTDADRAKHAVAIVQKGGTYFGLSNMSTEPLAAKTKDDALKEVRDWGIKEAYDPNKPLTAFSIYYADSDAKGTLPNAVLNMESAALRADLGK